MTNPARLRLVGARTWDTAEPIELTVSTDGPDTHAGVIDVTGLVAAPGYLDLQVNGAFGFDLTSDPSSVWDLASRLPRWGVTAFLPTIISSQPEVVAEAQLSLRHGPPPGWHGAVPLGLHCEGPMIAAARRGTHPAEVLIAPGPDGGAALIDQWGGLDHIAMVTLAPELPGASAVTRRLVAAGIVVAAGHSDADHATAVTSFGWGISHGTHLFNAMSGLDHRNPGLAAALLATPTVTAGIIADGVHVHPGVVAAAWQSKRSTGGLALVTDAMAAAGLGDGTYHLGPIPVRVEAGRAVNDDGRLAGSVLTMDEAVRNLRRFTGCSAAEAIAAASATPARTIGDPTRGALGSAGSGERADVVLLNDDLEVQMTVVGGRLVYTNPGGHS